jgi:hypothetical protein
MKTLIKTLFFILLFSANTSFSQSRANDLQDLVGVRGSSAEMELENRGYYHIKTAKSNYDIYSFWWNSRKKKCVSYHMADGRVVSVVNTLPADCNKSSNYNNSNNSYSNYNSYNHQYQNHSNNTHYSNRDHDAAFERGHTDGLYNKPYHNIYADADLKSAYSDGYGSGVGQRTSNTTYHSGQGGYKAHVEVRDLVNTEASSAYNKLKNRGFHEARRHVENGGLQIAWLNNRTKQCIKTVEKHDSIIYIKGNSAQCN